MERLGRRCRPAKPSNPQPARPRGRGGDRCCRPTPPTPPAPHSAPSSTSPARWSGSGCSAGGEGGLPSHAAGAGCLARAVRPVLASNEGPTAAEASAGREAMRSPAGDPAPRSKARGAGPCPGRQCGRPFARRLGCLDPRAAAPQRPASPRIERGSLPTRRAGRRVLMIPAPSLGGWSNLCPAAQRVRRTPAWTTTDGAGEPVRSGAQPLQLPATEVS